MTPTHTQRPWCQAMVVVVLTAALGGWGLGCEKSLPSQPPAPAQGPKDAAATGSDAPGSTTPGQDAGGIAFDLAGSAEAAPPPNTCASLRNCITRCATDSACQQRCMDAAPVPARTTYATITTCSKQGCPDFNDVNCRCEQECLGDSPCMLEVATCRDLEDDHFCDVECR